MTEERITALAPTTPETLAPAPKAFSLVPTTLHEAIQYAKLLAGSNLCPPAYRGKPDDVLIAIQLGLEVAGCSPLQAIQNIAVINGRPSMWGDLVLGVVKNSGLLESIIERDPQECAAKGEGSCSVLRHGEPEPVVRTFTMAMATTAGLLARSKDTGKGPGPWLTYPGRMLQMRARSWALRDAFPDVLKGLRIREEEEDQVITVSPVRRELPRRTSETAVIDAFLSESSGAVLPEAGPQAGSSPAPAGTAPHDVQPGNVYVGAINQVTTRNGTSPKGTWTLWILKTMGGDFGTFSASVGELAQRFAQAQTTARIEFTVTPKGSKNIETLTEYQGPAAEEPEIDEPGSGG